MGMSGTFGTTGAFGASGTFGTKHPSYDEHTIRYYDEHAPSFVSDTQGLSLNSILGEFLELVPDGGHVLDWGCGSGRDSLAMSRLGYWVTSTDASEAMCCATGELLGHDADIRYESFRELSEFDAYDGIWACSSLLHVRPDEMGTVLCGARDALHAGGVLYCSFKRGSGFGYRHGRWFTDMEPDELRGILEGVSLDVTKVWVTEDVRRGREGEQWVNALARRPETT